VFQYCYCETKFPIIPTSHWFQQPSRASKKKYKLCTEKHKVMAFIKGKMMVFMLQKIVKKIAICVILLLKVED